MTDSHHGPTASSFNLSDRFEVLPTADGSFTLKHKEIDETCHSLKGAFSEGHYYYVECTQLVQRYREKIDHGSASPLCILDVGFGTGLNYLATIKALAALTEEEGGVSASDLPPLTYISVEREEELLLYTKNNFESLAFFFPKGPLQVFPAPQDMQKTVYSASHPLPCYKARSCDGRHQLVILLGDAIDNLFSLRDELHGQVEVIFQDPFSPQKSARLWTLQWFMLLKELAMSGDGGAVLTTFSMSNMARKGLLAAGFEVVEGIPGYGNKQGATRAFSSAHAVRVVGDEAKAVDVTRSEAPLLLLREDPYYENRALERALQWQKKYPLTLIRRI